MSNSTWPDPSVNLTALDWGGITSIVPLLFGFGSNALLTPGLVNSTLYDTFTGNRAIVNASVNTSTIRANCGLLPNLSSTGGAMSVEVAASLNAVENITAVLVAPCELQIRMILSAEYITGKDEILFFNTAQYMCSTGICQDQPLLFLVSMAMQLDSSVHSMVSVNTTWQFTPMVQGT